FRPMWPSSARRPNTSLGNQRASSHSAACGYSSVSTYRRTAARNSSCSAVNGGIGRRVAVVPAPAFSDSEVATVSEPVGAPDHVQHDLVGPGTDAVQAQVSPGALDPILLHITGTAVDLDALV